MNDVLLYTYPQKDGKYRLKNTLAVAGMKVMPHLYYRLELKLYSGLLVLCWFMSCIQLRARRNGMDLLSGDSLVSYKRQKEK